MSAPKNSISPSQYENKQDLLSLAGFLKEKEILREIRQLGRKYNIDEVVPVMTSNICVAEWVRMKCKYGCKKYGKSWCCPPETPTPDQTKALLNEYQKAIMLVGSSKNTDFYRDNHQKRRRQVHIWKGTVAIERQLFLHGYYKAFALVSETCALCKECAYPDDCKFPTDRRPSLESLSIDVFQTLKNVGRPFRIATSIVEEHNCYSLILLE